MTLDEGVYVLSLIQYKPGWSFTLVDKGVRVSCKLPADATGKLTLAENETLTIERVTEFNLSKLHSANSLTDIVYDLILWLEVHEANEWFKVGGSYWVNPHPSQD